MRPRDTQEILGFSGVYPATPYTWDDYHEVEAMDLRQAVSLQVGLDPESEHENLCKLSQYSIRLALAEKAFGKGLKGWKEKPTDPPDAWWVLVEDYRAWSHACGLALPPEFPLGYNPEREGWRMPEVKKTRQTTKAPRAAPPDTAPELLREADIVGKIAPFSRATLWRRVKAGTFPKPLKVSHNITAWRRADVEQWLQAQGTPLPGK